jgi:adenylate cyclase
MDTQEEHVEQHLQVEINSALTRGGFIAFILGIVNFSCLLFLNVFHLVQDLWIPCIFALLAGLYSLIIYLFARKGAIHGPCIYKIFIPFVLLPTFFFVACSFFLPAGAASYITGPFSYLYFVIIVITGFLFTSRLAYLAGLIAGVSYFMVYLSSFPYLTTIANLDPLLMQDLSNPAVYAFKSLMMIFCGFLVGTLSRISKKLLFRVLKEEEEKIVITTTFGMIVDPRVRDRMIQGAIELGGETRVITVLFTDVRGFTTFSQAMTPKELLNFMKEFFDLMTSLIKREDGTIIEFVGDEIMALFGAPLPIEDHAFKSCTAALLMQRALESQRKAWKEQGKPEIRTGIGVHTGSMLVGNIGSSERYKYGAIGDNVNVGSRLQGLTKEYGVSIIASEDTVKELHGRFFVRELDHVAVRGRTEEIKIFEIVESSDYEIAKGKKELLEVYQKALECYYGNDYARALELFRTCRAIMPDDRASEILITRLEERETCRGSKESTA